MSIFVIPFFLWEINCFMDIFVLTYYVFLSFCEIYLPNFYMLSVLFYSYCVRRHTTYYSFTCTWSFILRWRTYHTNLPQQSHIFFSSRIMKRYYSFPMRMRNESENSTFVVKEEQVGTYLFILQFLCGQMRPLHEFKWCCSNSMSASILRSIVVVPIICLHYYII